MLEVNGKKIDYKNDQSLLSACLEASIYIPHLCYHPAIPSAEEESSCGLCLVSVDGNAEPVHACNVKASSARIVNTEGEAISRGRKKALSKMLATHPHACLTCEQAEGCSRTTCSMNVDVPERCCDLFGNCEVQKVSAFIGIPLETPRYKYAGLPKLTDQPFFNIDYNLCIACGRCIRICRDVKHVDVLKISEEFGRPVAVPKNGTLPESGCIYCGACVEVCPTGTLMDKAWEHDTREDSVVPCRASCPAEIDVPRYIQLVTEKRYGEAIAVIREKAPIPGILGRVCYNPCESGCRRKVWGEPVAIRSLKRFAADHDDQHWKHNLKTQPPSGKTVSIVGAGPAGLSTAYYLRILGHGVELYDSMDKPGGMLRYGIPRYRLPEDVLDKEIDAILDLGVSFHPGQKIESPEELSSSDAIFWATGASMSVPLPKGVDPEGLAEDGLSFLRRLNAGEEMKLDGEIAVIGGGNVATDVARCALRLGADKVTIIYRRTRDEMPAYESEIEEALSEGIEIRFLQAPEKVTASSNRIALTIQRMQLGEPDSSGRPIPIPVQGAISEIVVDHLFSAIGQKVETFAGVDVATSGGFAVVRGNQRSSVPGLYVGGDNVTGPASVVAAVEAGRLAAIEIDQFLGGEGTLPEYGIKTSDDMAASDQVRGGTKLVHQVRSEKTNGFGELETCYSEEQAVDQASRCARCDFRLAIPQAAMPPEKYMPYATECAKLIPDEPGIITLYDEQKNILMVSGSENMSDALTEKIADGFVAVYVTFEPHQMYTQRESEVLAKHLQKHGRLPAGNDLDDELF